MHFKNRQDAGQQLAGVLKGYAIKNPVVYGIPRGGVVCAAEIAKELHASLSLIITRKIGHPNNSEYAIGAVAEDGCRELTAEAKTINPIWLQHAIEQERREAARRREIYMARKSPLSAANKTAIIVDDGLATGSTMLVAIQEIRHLNPKQIFVAVPVSAASTIQRVSKNVDKVIALKTPANFLAIGAYYQSFEQVSDEEMLQVMQAARTKYKRVMHALKQKLRYKKILKS